MTHAFSTATLPWLLLAPLLAQETVTLSPAGLGDKVAFVHHAVQDQTMHISGQAVETRNEMWHYFTVTVESVDAEGVRTVRVALRRLRGSLQPSGSASIEFDTAGKAPDAPAPEDRIAAFGAALREAGLVAVGAEYTTKLDKHGAVQSSTGLGEKLQQALKRAAGAEAYVDGLLGDRTLSQLVRGAFGRLPKTPVAVGQSWKDSDETGGSMPMLRQMDLTLRSVDAEAAEITYTGKITAKVEDGKEPASSMEDGKVTGSIVLSRRDGFTMRGEAKTSMTVKTNHPQAGEVRVDLAVATTLERDKGDQGKDDAGKDAPKKDAPAKDAPAKDGG